MGRLGNSLFQIASTVAYAKKHGKDYVFPVWKYNKYLKNPLPEDPNIKSADVIYIEPNFHYEEIDFYNGNVDLMGYMQSYKYFENINTQDLFELKDEYKKQVDDLYAKINPEGKHLISLHIRRSDYLNKGTNEYHGILPIPYYTISILNLCEGYYRDKLFVIFSDDIEWCKNEPFFRDTIHNKYFVEGNEDIIDLFLMARCNDNIMANSSFSYWAYLLNRNENKRVVMPKNWFNNAPNCDTKDLYLPNAIII